MGEHRGVVAVAEGVGIDLDTRRADDCVAADVIQVGAGIDDQPDRPGLIALMAASSVLGRPRRSAVDEDQAVFPDVHGDVPAGAEDDVDVSAGPGWFRGPRASRARWARTCASAAARGGEQQAGDAPPEPAYTNAFCCVMIAEGYTISNLRRHAEGSSSSPSSLTLTGGRNCDDAVTCVLLVRAL